MAYPLLLSPLRIGPIELRNRIVSTAHQTTLVEDGLPTADFVAYHAARAAGGAGLICIEATAVHPSGLLTGHTIAGYDPRVVERLARVAEAVHAGGTRLFVQLFHGGREQIDFPPRAPAVAPSAVPSQRFKVEPRALSSGEIEEIVAHHELVAGHARAAGPRRHRAVRVARLPADAVPERALEPARRRLGRRRRSGACTTCEKRCSAMRRGAGDGLAVGIRLSADESAARGPPCPGDRRHPAHARGRGPDRLRERRDRRLGELPRRGLDRAASPDRTGRHAGAGRDPARAGSRCR